MAHKIPPELSQALLRSPPNPLVSLSGIGFPKPQFGRQPFGGGWSLLQRPTRVLQIEVADLWRLEAQHGCFLFCPYDDIEWIYDFDRIFFPNTHVFRHIRREDVYPERKSHLEILLDQYFMNERMIEAKRTWNPQGVKTVLIEAPREGCDPDVFPNGLPEHASWSDAVLQPWLELRPEQLGRARTGIDFRIEVREPQDTASVVARPIVEQLLHDLLPVPGIRSKLECPIHSRACGKYSFNLQPTSLVNAFHKESRDDLLKSRVRPDSSLTV